VRAAFDEALAVIRSGVDALPAHRRFLDEHLS
jgi:hypothetical protein